MKTLLFSKKFSSSTWTRRHWNMSRAVAGIIGVGTCLMVLGGWEDAMAQPAGDYADAPDGPGAQTYYPSMFPSSSGNAQFPTLYNTINSRIGAPGAHHLNVGQEWFGMQGAVPSMEVDATDPSDPDGTPNLVNSDGFDDGLPPIPFFIQLVSIPPPATITFFVSVAPGAPAGPRYVNILIDWDQNGAWEDKPGLLPEWIAKDYVVNVAPGTTKAISVPFTWGWNALLSPQIFWVRMTLTRTPVGTSGYNYVDANGCWDGSGVFAYGETEDYLFHPNVPLRGPIPWNPPGGGGGGGGGPGGPWVDIKAVPKSQVVAHGTRAYVDIVQVPPGFVNPMGPPSVDWWEADWAQRGWWLFTYSGRMDPNSTPVYTDPLTGSKGEFHSPPVPGGPPGTLWTITVDSIVHPLLPPTEVWPINVRVRWPGLLVKTVQAMVWIIHSGLEPFGMVGCYSHIEDTILDAPLDPPTMSAMAGLAQTGSIAFQEGDYTAASNALQQLRALAVTNQAVLEAHGRGEGTNYIDSFFDITYTIDFLDEKILTISTNTGPIPVPLIETPKDGAWVNNLVNIAAGARYTPLDTAWFEHFNEVSNSWDLISTVAIDPSTGHAETTWDTTPLTNGMHLLRVTYIDTANGREGHDMVYVRVDNTPPDFVPDLLPLPTPDVGGEVILTVTGVPTNFVGSCEIQITENGADFMTMGHDFYMEDGVEITIETSMIAEGVYQARATVKDEAGNEVHSAPIPLIVHPSYPSWKRMRGIESDEEDLEGDHIPAIWEYFYNLNPDEIDPPSAAVFDISPDPLGDLYLHAPRREWFYGLNLAVEGSPELAPSPAWGIIADNPPLQPSGEIEIPIVPLDPNGFFFRMRLSEE